MSLRGMTRNVWLQIGAALLVALVAMVLIRLHNAGGVTLATDSIAAGRKLAEAWCGPCHALDANAAKTKGIAPSFIAVADLPSTTELSLKVFLQSSHHNMPNLVLTPQQSEDIVNYLLSLKRR